MRILLNALTDLVYLIFLFSAPIAIANESDCWKMKGEAKLKACTAIINSKKLLGAPITNKNLAIIFLIVEIFSEINVITIKQYQIIMMQ